MPVLMGLKQHLCLALLHNCLTPTPAIYAVVCDIFHLLVLRFRSTLKAEVGIFFPLVALRPLEATTDAKRRQVAAVTPEAVHRAHMELSLNLLLQLCQQPQVLVDLYVNYDCDLEAANLWERTVVTLVDLLERTPAQVRVHAAPRLSHPLFGRGTRGGGAVENSGVHGVGSHCYIALENPTEQEDCSVNPACASLPPSFSAFLRMRSKEGAVRSTQTQLLVENVTAASDRSAAGGARRTGASSGWYAFDGEVPGRGHGITAPLGGRGWAA